MPAGLDATLVLLRHGESEYIVEGRFQGQAETPLTELGRARRRSPESASPHRPAPPPCRSRWTADRDRPLAAAADDRDRVGRGDGHRRGPPGLGVPARPAGPGIRRDRRKVPGKAFATTRSPSATATSWPAGGVDRPRPGRRMASRRWRSRSASDRRSPGLVDRLAAGRAPGTLDRSQVAGYRDAGRRGPAVGHRRRPRRRLQGAPADPVRPAARALLDLLDSLCARSPSSRSGPAGRRSSPTT